MLSGDCDLAFHHVGVACADIEAEAARLAPLGYAPEAAPFVDPVQGVRGMFLTGQAPRLELLEPLEADRPGVLTSYLARETKLYHLAYLTSDLDKAIDNLRRERAKLIVAPVPAVAFDGRPIAFLVLPNLMLVELVAESR